MAWRCIVNVWYFLKGDLIDFIRCRLGTLERFKKFKMASKMCAEIEFLKNIDTICKYYCVFWRGWTLVIILRRLLLELQISFFIIKFLSFLFGIGCSFAWNRLFNISDTAHTAHTAFAISLNFIWVHNVFFKLLFLLCGCIFCPRSLEFSSIGRLTRAF